MTRAFVTFASPLAAKVRLRCSRDLTRVLCYTLTTVIYLSIPAFNLGYNNSNSRQKA